MGGQWRDGPTAVRATRAALEISSVWESGSQFPQATRQSRRERTTDGYLAGRRAVLGARIAVGNRRPSREREDSRATEVHGRMGSCEVASR
jgi:hypothetical protein